MAVVNNVPYMLFMNSRCTVILSDTPCRIPAIVSHHIRLWISSCGMDCGFGSGVACRIRELEVGVVETLGFRVELEPNIYKSEVE